jgi:hypothetical protein
MSNFKRAVPYVEVIVVGSSGFQNRLKSRYKDGIRSKVFMADIVVPPLHVSSGDMLVVLNRKLLPFKTSLIPDLD